MHLYQFDTTIYPSVTTNLWQGEGYQAGSPANDTTCGAKELVDILSLQLLNLWLDLKKLNEL